MFCRYCGKRIEEGTVCDCQKAVNMRVPAKEAAYRREPIQPEKKEPYKRGWSVCLILSMIFSVFVIFSFALMMFFLSDMIGSGETLELLIYAIPAAFGILACLMALISFKDKHLWKISLIAFVIGLVFTVIVGCAFFIVSGGPGTFSGESVSETEKERDDEDKGNKDEDRDKEEPTETGDEDNETDSSENAELRDLRERYQSGRLDYAGLKEALSDLHPEELEGDDVDVYLELVGQAQDDLTESIEKQIEAKQYDEAFGTLSDILERLPEDETASELRNLYKTDYVLYLQEQSAELAKQGKGDQARSLLEDAREDIQDDDIIDNMLDNLEKSKQKTENDYIIEDSDSRYLTNDDVKDLSLQEINYAKNEIYARHGRKFASRELQDYFDGKAWYRGTVEPDDFSSSVFNKYERANAEFLSDVEFKRDSKGYLLDQ